MTATDLLTVEKIRAKVIININNTLLNLIILIILGDSGGPLMCPINGKATLVAVVSRGNGCADPGTSGIYSATFFVKQWIADTIASN